MRNPALVAAAGLLALAALLPFARVEGPVVIPLTVAVLGAVAIVLCQLTGWTRPRHRGPTSHPPAPDEADDEETVPRLHRAA